VLPANSVGTTQIKRNGVRNADIRANAVTSGKVRNGSLLAADFKAGQLPSGKAGASGMDGVAGATGAKGDPGQDAVPGVGLSSVAAFITTTGGEPTVIAGLTQSFTVGAGQTRRVVATFSAESLCYGVGSWCSVRILVDGTELNSAVGGDFQFDANDGGGAEAGSLQRYSGNLAAGAHSVELVVQNSNDGLSLVLDDMVLSVLQVAAA
jgi:hypothetical protein